MACDYQEFETRYKGRLIAMGGCVGPNEDDVRVVRGKPMSRKELREAVKSAKWVHTSSWDTSGYYIQYHKSAVAELDKKFPR